MPKNFDADEALELLELDEGGEEDFDLDVSETDLPDVETQTDLAEQLISEFKSEKPDPATVVSILESLVSTLI